MSSGEEAEAALEAAAHASIRMSASYNACNHLQLTLIAVFVAVADGVPTTAVVPARRLPMPLAIRASYLSEGFSPASTPAGGATTADVPAPPVSGPAVRSFAFPLPYCLS